MNKAVALAGKIIAAASAITIVSYIILKVQEKGNQNSDRVNTSTVSQEKDLKEEIPNYILSTDKGETYILNKLKLEERLSLSVRISLSRDTEYFSSSKSFSAPSIKGNFYLEIFGKKCDLRQISDAEWSVVQSKLFEKATIQKVNENDLKSISANKNDPEKTLIHSSKAALFSNEEIKEIIKNPKKDE